MKDAKGHGSNKRGETAAHQAGVSNVGTLNGVPLTQQALERLDTDTLDRAAFGYTNGQQVTVDPKDVRIQYHDDLVNPQDKFAKGGMSWAKSVDLSEPVKFDVLQDGHLYIADGHHRWFAASKTGRKITGEVEVKAKPIKAILERGVKR